MSDNDRVLTEEEHQAILASFVAKETAELKETNAALSAQVASLTTEVATAKAATDVEIAKVAAAEKALEDFKAAIATAAAEAEAAETLEALKVTRVEALKAAGLSEEFLTDEDRVARISAMDEAEFTSYSADLASVAVVATKVEDKKTTKIVTAAKGADVKTEAPSLADLGMTYLTGRN